MAAKLRAVETDEKPPPKKRAPRKPRTPKIASVQDAAERGTRLDEMVQMRKVIARALDNPATSARDLAALSRRQLEISKEIESLKREREQEARRHADTTDEAWDAEAI